ncbi:glucosyltransferase domain-containing protein [Enterobacter hormaechei]|uniref:glucosyltransferase domain-containing protein n=2 Tax=Enterobacter hormaechei TaxID=158836 RepID=UPI003314F02F
MTMLNYKKAYIWFAIASLAYLFPIIKADRYFIDDYNRAILGYLSWSDNGRPLADIVMSVINFGTTISDISPLTQVLGIASLSAILAFILRKNTLSPVQAVLCSMCVIASPFMMETLSYAYDSLPMLLSIALIFISFLLTPKNNYVAFAWHLICVISSLCLYQASLGIYVVLALLNYIEKENKNFKGLLTLLSNALAFILSYLIYSRLIAPNFISGGYSTKRSEMISLTSDDAFHAIVINIEKYISFAKLGYPKPFFVVCALLFAVGFCGLMIRARDFYCSRMRASSIAMVITLLSPFVIAFMAIVPLSILAFPPIMSRVLTVVGAGTMFMMYYSFRSASGARYVISACIAALFFCYSYSTIYAYGNAQTRQKDFETYAIGLMQNDISLYAEKNIFDLYGGVPASPVSALIISQHPIMAWTVLSNVTFRDEWRTNIALQNYRFQSTYKQGSFEGDIKSPPCSNMIKGYNGMYSLFKKNGVLLFYFKDICK